MDGYAGAPIPEHRRLTLIGESYGNDRGRLFPAQTLDHGARRGEDGRPDDLGVVLHPARGRIDLLKGLLFGGNQGAVRGKRDCTTGAGALVDGQQNSAGRRFLGLVAHTLFPLEGAAMLLLSMREPAAPRRWM